MAFYHLFFCIFWKTSYKQCALNLQEKMYIMKEKTRIRGRQWHSTSSHVVEGKKAGNFWLELHLFKTAPRSPSTSVIGYTKISQIPPQPLLSIHFQIHSVDLCRHLSNLLFSIIQLQTCCTFFSTPMEKLTMFSSLYVTYFMWCLMKTTVRIR